MDTTYACCCGLDVHKRTVVACVMQRTATGTQKVVRTFGTMTPNLLDLADWLTTVGCSHVTMESTGIYWKPVFNLLEGVFEVLVVNAQHLKACQGARPI